MASPRRPDIDWLRIFATYLLFVFHTAMVFNPAPFYHVRNADLSFAMLVVCGFIGLWHMPLFFLLAGWSAAAAFGTRGTRGFARERVRRLFVPLLAGCVLLAPAIKWVELRSGLDLNHRALRVAPALQAGFETVIPGGLPVAEPFDESFFTFLPTFFTDLDRFTWSHLWFLAYLFTFSMAYLPLLAWLAHRRDRFASAGRWAIYLPLVPLVVIQLTMRGRWAGIYNLYDDWANVAYYTTFFLGGFLLACHPALERLVDREWRRALGIGAASTVVLLLAVLGVVGSPTVLLLGAAVAGWCFVLALVGFARRACTTSNRTLAYLAASALPVYVLHQSAIVLPGYLVVGLAVGIVAKFLLLLVVSVTLTLATYHWVVRPFRVPRFLLGMRASVALGVVLSASGTALAATPVGLWYAEGGAARVEIEPCGAELCGRVVWLRAPLDEDGCSLRDRHNPDPALRERTVIGLEILRGLARRPDGTWGGGRIYDPGTGNTYACQVNVEGDDRLRLRGYVGIPLLGRTATWVRVGREKRVCAARGDH